jgi:hypothetical protein
MAFDGPTVHDHRPLCAESARLWAEARLKMERLAALRSQFWLLTEELEGLAQQRILDGQSGPALADYVRCILGKLGSRLDLFVDKPTELAAIAKISVECFIADEEKRAELSQTSHPSEEHEGASTSAQATIIAWPAGVPARPLREPQSPEATVSPWLNYHLRRLRMMAIFGELRGRRRGSESQLMTLSGAIGQKLRSMHN